MNQINIDDFFDHARVKEDYCYNAYFELTHACNYNCVHCYLPRRNNGQNALAVPDYEAAAEDLREAGTFIVSLTGGEPLLHPDFFKIYRLFKEKGFFVGLMTNGYLLTEEHFRLFEELPPRIVEISLYGFDPEVYRQYTRTQGDPAVIINNARRLRAMGIDLALKTVMTRLNEHEVTQYRVFAQEIGARFRYDTAINPDIHGNTLPCHYRASCDKVLEADRLNVPFLIEKPIILPARKTANPERKRFVCGIGQNMVAIDPDGNAHPCLLYRDQKWNIRKHRLSRILKAGFPHVRSMTRSFALPCDECGMASQCNFCGATLLMLGDRASAMESYCETTRKRIDLWKENGYAISEARAD